MAPTTLSLCETTASSTLTPVHIRDLGPGPALPGGGITGRALCGRDLAGGWDLPGPELTLSRLDALAALPPGSPNPLCPRCAGAARPLLHP